jgi:hypothetical protein
MGVTSGTYSMDVDSQKKVFFAFAEGLFDLEAGNNFCNAFIETANRVSQSKDYTLIVDVKGVRPSSPEVQQALGQALALYASENFSFKKRFMTKLSSVIAQSQVARLAQAIPEFQRNVVFVDTKEEALSKI